MREIALGEWGTLPVLQAVLVRGTTLELEYLGSKSEYGGHQFEELGDEITRELRVRCDGQDRTFGFSAWERDPDREGTCCVGPWQIELRDKNDCRVTRREAPGR